MFYIISFVKIYIFIIYEMIKGVYLYIILFFLVFSKQKLKQAFLFSQKCLPKLKMDIYKCPKMEKGKSNMEKPLFVTIIEN